MRRVTKLLSAVANRALIANELEQSYVKSNEIVIGLPIRYSRAAAAAGAGSSTDRQYTSLIGLTMVN